ncbi:chromosome segregation ATPase [Paraburkholderia sp. 40]
MNSGPNCEKSRVRIDHPDLPADLGPAAGELVAALWTRATAAAEAALDALRDEVEAQRVEAQRSVVAARDELGRVETALEQRTAALLAAQVEGRELEKAQAEGHAARQACEAEVVRLKAEALARDRELDEVREGFSRDLEKLRESAERAEERLRASEKRAPLEIDRERGAAAKLQKELDEATKRADRREADHRSVVEALQAQLGNVRHQAGVLQGRLDAVEAANVTLQHQLAAARQTDARPARPARAKAAPARPTAARPALTRPLRPSATPGPSRKPSATPASPATASKPVVRRKRG